MPLHIILVHIKPDVSPFMVCSEPHLSAPWVPFGFSAPLYLLVQDPGLLDGRGEARAAAAD